MTKLSRRNYLDMLVTKLPICINIKFALKLGQHAEIPFEQHQSELLENHEFLINISII